jgi:hypothetical protein
MQNHGSDVPFLVLVNDCNWCVVCWVVGLFVPLFVGWKIVMMRYLPDQWRETTSKLHDDEVGWFGCVCSVANEVVFHGN